MRILPLSDLHLELTSAGWDLPDLPPFDVMVMAGDLIPDMTAGVEWLAERVGDSHAVFIAGNHEHYGCRNLDENVEYARAAAKGTRVHVLSDERVDLLGCTFIGSTLWTDFNLLGNQDAAMTVAGDYMSDYRQIVTEGRLLQPSDTLERHLASRRFIADEAASAKREGRKVVVTTHHGVHQAAVRPGMRGKMISAAYSNAMDAFVSECGADLWVYGHTHISDDRMLGRTRVINNGKGYGPSKTRARHDNESFDPILIIEI
ncbi:MAG: metallophosphoesterase [Tardiphaga sp.]|uniref:metallophosphoesterase n=1 Tax=Tardiphaga sp. TaxID=1926292 RepID=UPI0026314370|nr:metallophosphoesterase [Tardiphaga sp.]MDB5501102.1 metallophosphoesterase [Tardiphaga sp.]